MRRNCRTEQVITPVIQSDSLATLHALFSNKSDIHPMCLGNCFWSSFWFMEWKDLLSADKVLRGFHKRYS